MTATTISGKHLLLALSLASVMMAGYWRRLRCNPRSLRGKNTRGN
jgi:hypothetical protein